MRNKGALRRTAIKNSKRLIAVILFILLVLLCTALCFARVRVTGNHAETPVLATAVPSTAPEATSVPSVEPTEEPEVKKEPVFTNDDDIDASAEVLKGFLEQYTDNENMICAILGMFKRESRFFSYRVAHQRANSMAWTEEIDKGLADGSTREYFIDYTRNTSGGYGLGMWSSTDYLTELYDFAREWGTSIGDAEMQCAFVVYDLQTNYPELCDEICNAKNEYYAGERIGMMYERTADYEGVGSNAQYYRRLFYGGK